MRATCRRFVSHTTMKYNCAKEFNLKTIYQKLISKSHVVETVKACDFFTHKSELQMLQEKMEKISEMSLQFQHA